VLTPRQPQDLSLLSTTHFRMPRGKTGLTAMSVDVILNLFDNTLNEYGEVRH